MKNKRFYLSPRIKTITFDTSRHLMIPDSLKYDDGTVVDDEASKRGFIDDDFYPSSRSPWGE